MPSDRAKRLIEALHEPHSLDARWEIAERFLAEERNEIKGFLGLAPRMSDPPEVWRRYYQGGGVPLREIIAQTKAQNGETE
jgi:hypothetical protein